MLICEMEDEIKEAYDEDTIGRKYRAPIVTKNNIVLNRDEPASEVDSLNFTKPMAWKEFTELPASLKEMYIKHLKDQYNISASQFADMLGVHYSTFNRVIRESGIVGVFNRGRNYPTTKQEREWKEFLNRRNDANIDTSDQPKCDNTNDNTEYKSDDDNGMAEVLTCSFKLRGVVNLDDIKNKIKTMTLPNTMYDIQISIRQFDNTEVNR